MSLNRKFNPGNNPVRVIVFGAHPDDYDLVANGISIKYVRGKIISYVPGLKHLALQIRNNCMNLFLRSLEFVVSEIEVIKNIYENK